MRVLRVRVSQPGFCTWTLTLVTTLHDPVAYPAQEIIAAYQRRWRIELCLDDLKTALGLDALRCKSPALIHRELLALLVAHNLVRAVMAAPAQAHPLPLERLSFTGKLTALGSFAAAAAQAKNAAQQRRLWAALLARLAADLVPWRPDRYEPARSNAGLNLTANWIDPATSTVTSATAPVSAAPPSKPKCHSAYAPRSG